MRYILIILSVSISFFTACRSKNYIYSNSELNKRYSYDSHWDYKGYKDEIIDSSFWVYDPDREDQLLDDLKEKGERY